MDDITRRPEGVSQFDPDTFIDDLLSLSECLDQGENENDFKHDETTGTSRSVSSAFSMRFLRLFVMKAGLLFLTLLSMLVAPNSVLGWVNLRIP